MASIDNNNMDAMINLGFKGAGHPNGVPAYNPNGLYTLGGVQDPSDTAVMYYGIAVCSDPADDDGIFSVGAEAVAGVASVFNLEITAGCTAAGDINIDGTVIALLLTDDTVNEVAAKIRAATYSRWTVTGSGANAIFTAKGATVYTAPTRAYYSTGVAGTLTTTTAGTVGSILRGISIYRPDIAMLDTAKPNYILQGQPLTICYFGNVWIGSWTKVATGAIDPILGCKVIAKNDTGVIEFIGSSTAVPSGYTQLTNTSVKSVSLDTNGALLLVNI
jgi:hypothetical protein